MASYTRPGSVGGTTGGSFNDRMTELKKLVGTGKIEASLTVSQAYAQYQHEGVGLAHPRGGEAHFLTNALNATYKELYSRVAQGLFRGNVQQDFIKYTDTLNTATADRTPVELDNLRRSGASAVKVGGRFIYQRAAAQRKLTRSELNNRVRLYHREALQRRFGGA
jgi:hypothetical protein